MVFFPLKIGVDNAVTESGNLKHEARDHLSRIPILASKVVDIFDV